MSRILVTNDDGIDSVGLHELARALAPLGEVVVVAPDSEYSGASAALGALHLLQPEVRRAHVDGIVQAWTVNGPPGLCVMFSRLGVFGPIDLVVSGINPGANVGRAIYHSGTVGAALTARNGGISGVAVSQAVSQYGVEGQGWDEMIAGQRWATAATVGAEVVAAVLADLPAEPVVVNVNVPNVAVSEIAGWRQTEVAMLPPRTIATGRLHPIAGRDGAVLGRDGVGRPDRAAGPHGQRGDRAGSRDRLVPQPAAGRAAARPGVGAGDARSAAGARSYTHPMTTADGQLDAYRASIDNIDAALVHLLAERFKITKAVGRYKAAVGLPAADPDREQQQVARLRALAVESGLDPAFTEEFLRFIVDEVIRHHKRIAAE